MSRWRLHSIALTSLLWLEAPAFALDDPTRPTNFSAPAAVAAPEAPQTQLRLYSTLISPQRSVAVINGRILGRGDSIDGATVAEIRPGQVTLTRLEEVIELRLLSGQVERRSPQRSRGDRR